MTSAPSDCDSRLVILTQDFGGGTGNHLLEMMHRWDLNRWRPTILTSAPRTARVRPPVPVHRLPAERTSLYPLAQLLRLRRVARLVREYSPDILHTYFFWPVLYGRLLKLSGVVDVLVENREDEGFGWGTHEYAWLRLTRSLPDSVVCVSEAVRRIAVEREGLDRRRTRVIHNGIAPSPPVRESDLRSARERWGLSPSDLVVGMVANLNRPVKGGEYFLRAASAIADVVPRARFLLVGLGGLDPDLRELVRSLGIESRLVCTGYVDDVATYYELMDVSVLTSLTEGLSITLLESMSHGLPVVATRVGGNPEVVVDGETGFLVPPEDVSALAARAVDLLTCPEMRRRMGRAGRERVRSHFALSDTAARYEELFAEICTGSHEPVGAAGLP